MTKHNLNAGDQKLNLIKAEVELLWLASNLINPGYRIGGITLHYQTSMERLQENSQGFQNS